MILLIENEEVESIATLLGEINNVEVIIAHFINFGILSWNCITIKNYYKDLQRP